MHDGRLLEFRTSENSNMLQPILAHPEVTFAAKSENSDYFLLDNY